MIQKIINNHAKWLMGEGGERANLTGMDLVGVDLRGAGMKGMGLTDTNLAGADLTGADLTGASLRNANLSGTNLTGAYLTRRIWTDPTIIVIQPEYLHTPWISDGVRRNMKLRGR